MELTKNCTGCMACLNKCPNNAIDVVYNEAGFYIPRINEEKCTNCGLCNLVCPQNKTAKTKEEPKVCYSIMANDEIRKNSASGGLFAVIAEEYLKNGGYVCGAAFTDDFRQVNHIIIDKKQDLIKLQNSQYVQSNIGGVFSEIKKLLDNNKEVLFGGTPCQVAGLDSFLGKNYDNLLTLDLVCHGIPSPQVWEKYINEIADGKIVRTLSFRNKLKRWGSPYELIIDFQNNTKFKEPCFSNIYYRSFFEHLILNESCYNCKYSNLQRPADITIGDFWGINNYDSSLDDGLGTSLAIANSSKGKSIIQKLKNSFKTFQEIPIQYALNNNPRLSVSSERNLKNKDFVEKLNLSSITKNLKTNLIPKYDGIILNYWNIPNFGATLSAYAIQKYFSEHGFYYHLLKTRTSPKFVEEFAEKYLKTTHLVKSPKHLQELNKSTNNFIIGTDQVLREDFVIKDLTKSLLGFTQFNKKRISFSGSFGNDTLFELNNAEKLLYSKYIRRFDAISTRELSGIDICKNEFHIKAEHIIDPVFLIDKSIWDKMAAKTENKYKGKIVTYLFFANEETDKMLQYLGKKYNKEVVALENGKISQEEFLSGIKNADYVVTNSFHGMCFSLIFHKKVLCINSITSGRFNTLAQLFGIKDLFINNYYEVFTKENLFSEYDRNHIEKIINKERGKAKVWFNQNIAPPKKITLNKIFNELDYKATIFAIEKWKKVLNFFNNRKLIFLTKYSSKKIVFWGASIFLHNFLKEYKINRKNVLGIVDKNSERHLKKLYNYTIYPPEKLAELKPDIVICSIKNNHEEIYPQVKKYLQENYPQIELLPDIFE